jgi:hypothetical protein
MAMPESYNVSARLAAEFNRATEKKNENYETIPFSSWNQTTEPPASGKVRVFTALFARLMETVRLLKGDIGLRSDVAGYGEQI